MSQKLMFLVFSLIYFRESNQILKDIIYNDDNDKYLKTQDANFSLPIKNPNPLFKNGFGTRIRIPKLGGFRIPDSDCQPY